RELGFRMDDPVLDGYYAYLEQEQLPILFHVADPVENWDIDKVGEKAKEYGWYYGDGTYPTKEELHDELEGFLTKFPRLRVIFAHFAFLHQDMEETAAFLDRWPSISYDLTPGTLFKDFVKDPKG